MWFTFEARQNCAHQLSHLIRSWDASSEKSTINTHFSTIRTDDYSSTRSSKVERLYLPRMIDKERTKTARPKIT